MHAAERAENGRMKRGIPKTMAKAVEEAMDKNNTAIQRPATPKPISFFSDNFTNCADEGSLANAAGRTPAVRGHVNQPTMAYRQRGQGSGCHRGKWLHLLRAVG